MSHRTLNRKQFYHGTTARLNPGDVVAPVADTGQEQVHRIGDPEHAYATTNADSAHHYAELAHNHHVSRAPGPPFRAPKVYQVEPVGQHESDPNTHGEDFRSRQGWRVTGREPWNTDEWGDKEDWRV